MNLKKFFVALILLVMTTCLLSGCNSTTSTVSDDKKAPHTVSTFVTISRESLTIAGELNQAIVYDPETMVMYTVIFRYKHGVSTTPMYNPDGTLRLYNPNGESGGE